MSISLSSLLKDEYKDTDIATEAGLESKTTNPDAPMGIGLITDKIIMRSNLKPVTDPISYSGNMPTPGGLFSPDIFGVTLEERSKQFAYIDLNEKFFHPYVYEVLKNLMPKRFEKCAAGEGSWIISTTGDLIELKMGDPAYDENNTGLAWLIKSYKDFVYKDSDSLVRKDRIKLMGSLSEDEVFISKWLVIPILYRDVDTSGSMKKLPDLDVHYNNIIRYANNLRDSTFDFFNNQVRFNLQQELVAIRKQGQQLLEKKTGFFHRFMLGKSVDRGSRDVISVPVMNNMDKPSDNPVDIFHSGIPISKCLICGYDFILRYCKQFFSDNFHNRKDYPVYSMKNGKYEIVGSVPIKDMMTIIDDKYIEKKIKRFDRSHGTRFEYIMIETESGNQIPMHMTGEFGSLKPGTPNSSTILNRPMTWTDLFYLAAENTLSDKYVYITRYPIEGINSIFPTQVRVMSTIKTVDAIIDGKRYPYYPLIDLSTPTDRISNCFVDTVTFSNMYLDAIGGDFNLIATESL